MPVDHAVAPGNSKITDRVKQRAKRHDVGKTVKRAESIKEHQARRG
jgi:hypothetical protein